MGHFFVLVTFALFCAVQCQHHGHTHPTQQVTTTGESGEKDKYTFTYDQFTHDMIIRQGHNCYVMPLSDAQKAKVHDPVAITTVEADALRLIADGASHSTLDQSSLDHHTSRDCRGATLIIKLVASDR